MLVYTCGFSWNEHFVLYKLTEKFDQIPVVMKPHDEAPISCAVDGCIEKTYYTPKLLIFCLVPIHWIQETTQKCSMLYILMMMMINSWRFLYTIGRRADGKVS